MKCILSEVGVAYINILHIYLRCGQQATRADPRVSWQVPHIARLAQRYAAMKKNVTSLAFSYIKTLKPLNVPKLY
jgi:hypothetical protein